MVGLTYSAIERNLALNRNSFTFHFKTKNYITLHCNKNNSLQCESKKSPPWGFLAFFPKLLGIFSPNFTRLLYVPIYARLQILVHLSKTLTKLRHIKCDHPVHTICSKCPPSAKAHTFRCLRKSLIALLIVVCGKSSQICCSALFSSGMVFGFDLSLWNAWSITHHTSWHMVVEWVEWGLVSGGHWSFAQFVVIGYFTHS